MIYYKPFKWNKIMQYYCIEFRQWWYFYSEEAIFNWVIAAEYMY